MAIIETKNLIKNFGPKNVLNSVNCEIESGEVVCVIGPSGSGKRIDIWTSSYFELATRESVSANQ